MVGLRRGAGESAAGHAADPVAPYGVRVRIDLGVRPAWAAEVGGVRARADLVVSPVRRLLVGPTVAAMPATTTRYGVMLTVLMSAMFMAQFDFFVVNVAAPDLQHDLGASEGALQLVVGGYAFAYGGAMITGGRLGDIFGHRRLFVHGTLGFAIASLLCALAAGPGELVAARLVQGFTGALMIPQILALVTATFPALRASAGPDRYATAMEWTAGICLLGMLAFAAIVAALGRTQEPA
jgi:MFS family permease